MPALLAAALSLAGPVPLPRYNPGDAFVFSDGRVERVVADEGDHVVWRGLRGPSYRRSRNFIVPVLRWRSGRGLGARKVRGDPDRLWPIEKPRSVRFRVITETRKHPRAARRRSVAMWVCKSSKPRSFAVPAGTFEAIPFLCDRYSTTTMRLIERREWDYAPALGHYIRRVRHHYLRGTFSSIELVAALSGPAATEARIKALSRKARADRLAER
ncbi:hypothetical protein [Erythrobacter sp.]|uniref:hypothetical protein n=1 Tax=Erythrobacter sp. TaxID=1042 RepID=UPI001425F786|nr:hypothetical protein [Erythrobacter sp.]QIQ85466.1 MAG: hypothetical protein G9473_01300 [Erythrobacter sp.]